MATLNQMISIQSKAPKNEKLKVNRDDIILKLLKEIRDDKSYMVMAHGQSDTSHTNFKVPSGKYIIFLSDPGVQLSASILTDTKFHRVLHSKHRIAQMITGTLPALVKPAGLRRVDFRKSIFFPGTVCHDMILQMVDPVPLRHRLMGLFKLPVSLGKSDHFFQGTTTTLKNIILNGAKGLYIVGACRGFKDDVDLSIVNANKYINAISKNRIKYGRLPVFSAFTHYPDRPINARKKAYINVTRALLQNNPSISGQIPFHSQSRAQALKNIQSNIYKKYFLPSTPTPRRKRLTNTKVITPARTKITAMLTARRKAARASILTAARKKQIKINSMSINR